MSLNKLMDDAKLFIGDLVCECSKNGIALFISPQPVHDNFAGFFDPFDSVLSINNVEHGKVLEWFPTMIHEYCHMVQYLEDPKSFKKIGKNNEKVIQWLLDSKSTLS
jgi:hypothetical protein